MKTKFGFWYNEFNGVVTHDYLNIIICQFPLLTFRKYIFEVDGACPCKVFTFAFLGFSLSTNPKYF